VGWPGSGGKVVRRAIQSRCFFRPRFKYWGRIITPTSICKFRIAAKGDWSHETQSLDDLPGGSIT
ncbi:MAG: hypothetical protein LQ349_006362, partial [Xanthoria aureola]